MKQYRLEIALLIVQLLTFYIFPLFAGPTDAMGMVLLILLTTLLLSAAMGGFSAKRLRLLWPVAVAALFIPSVPVYYNESALIHAAWYFVVSGLGLLSGLLLRLLFKRKG